MVSTVGDRSSRGPGASVHVLANMYMYTRDPHRIRTMLTSYIHHQLSMIHPITIAR